MSNGKTVRVAQKTTYAFDMAASTTSTIFLGPRVIRTSERGAGELIVRVSEGTSFVTAAGVVIDLLSASVSPEDPATVFYEEAPLASLLILGTDAFPNLYSVAYSNAGDGVAVRMTVLYNSTPGVSTLVAAVDLGMKASTTPFAPERSAGLWGWWDASYDAGRWQDSAGTTPCVANGDPCGRLDDMSGNTNHLLQATGGLRGTYDPDGGGQGKKAIVFDGVSQFLQTGNREAFGPVMIFAVFKVASLGYILFHSDGDAVANGGEYLYFPNTASAYSSRSGGGGGINIVWSTDLLQATLFDKNDGLGGGLGLLQNGVPTTSSGSSGTMNVAYVTLGASNAGASPSNLTLCEALVYSTYDVNTVSLARQYLRRKWGTP